MIQFKNAVTIFETNYLTICSQFAQTEWIENPKHS